MPYAVSWLPAAELDLDRIAQVDPVSASRVLDEVEQLASNPVSLGRKASFPHLPFQKYQFWAGDLFITVLFRYGSDE